MTSYHSCCSSPRNPSNRGWCRNIQVFSEKNKRFKWTLYLPPPYHGSSYHRRATPEWTEWNHTTVALIMTELWRIFRDNVTSASILWRNSVLEGNRQSCRGGSARRRSWLWPPKAHRGQRVLCPWTCESQVSYRLCLARYNVSSMNLHGVRGAFIVRTIVAISGVGPWRSVK